MNKALFYDTETNGMPDWKVPSDSEHQPHIVQLAAVLIDLDTGNLIEDMAVIIKPDGWIITPELTAIHGITHAQACEVGMPEKKALEQFIELWDGNKRVAFNRTFDQRIIRIALKRFSDQETIDRWADKEGFDCAMLMANKIMKIGKYPKLEEAYKHFTGKRLIGAHSAMADTRATVEVYMGICLMQEREAVKDLT